MFSSIYIGYSGLLGFSKGLNALSHNVANLNTPGFKSSELLFRDLLYRQGLGGNNNDPLRVEVGGGVDAPASRVRFRQGELRDTGSALDVAINGNGFFILHDGGQTFYTRSGQFEFGSDGFLADKTSSMRVAALAGSANFEDIQLNGLRTSSPQATGEVSFIGNLSRGGSSHQLTQVNVFDAVGTSHALSLTFTNNNSVTSGSWLVEVRDSANAVVANGEIRFQGNGSPATGFNTMSFAFNPAGAPASTITLDLGEPGSFSGATNFSGGTTSDIKIERQDGRAAGSLTEATFDDRGFLTLKYSNGQTNANRRLALAWFDNLSELTQRGGGLFTAPANARPRIGSAGDGMMGKIEPKKIELSNVELTSEFTEMIVIQRGYQASSQVISVTNEMIQQLFDLRSRR